MVGAAPTLPGVAQGVDLNSLVNRTNFQPSAPPGQGVTINIGTGAGSQPDLSGATTKSFMMPAPSGAAPSAPVAPVAPVATAATGATGVRPAPAAAAPNPLIGAPSSQLALSPNQWNAGAGLGNFTLPT
jgi:hypothetical protein